MVDSTAIADALLETLGRFRRQARRSTPRPGVLAGLSSAQLELIRLLRRDPGISVAEAADTLGLAANTVSTLVGRLVESGHVTRTPDPADRRIARLALAPDAAVEVAAWRDRRTAAVAAVLDDLDPDEVATVIAVLEVLDRISDQLPAAGVLAGKGA